MQALKREVPMWRPAMLPLFAPLLLMGACTQQPQTPATQAAKEMRTGKSARATSGARAAAMPLSWLYGKGR